ncbi:MAG: trigger factor, partial [Odoribacter sp.]|nr:trigger factor [Odoribacter sp.]
DEKGQVKEGGIKNEDASMSLHYMKDEKSLKAFKNKKVGNEVKFNAAKAYPNKTDFAAMLGVKKEEAENAGENYCFVIKEIKRFVDAEVNEELFTKLYGEGVVKDAADFRARVKADIENQLKGHSEYRFTIDAKEKMVKKNEDVVLPEAFLKRWIVAVNENMTPEQVEKDFADYRGEFKWQLIKSAIVKEFDVKVEAEDMKREGRQIAAAQLQQYGLYGLTDEQLDGFAAKLLEDQKQREHLYERALDNKVYAVIRENVKLEEQEIAMADFEKLFQK